MRASSLCDKVTEKKFLQLYNETVKTNVRCNMAVINVTIDNFKDEVLNSDKPVLIDFWASWCGPCRMMGPVVDEIAEERDDIKVCKVNVDEERELANLFQISSIPTLAVVKDGNVVNGSVGVRPKKDILRMI